MAGKLVQNLCAVCATFFHAYDGHGLSIVSTSNCSIGTTSQLLRRRRILGTNRGGRQTEPQFSHLSNSSGRGFCWGWMSFISGEPETALVQGIGTTSWRRDCVPHGYLVLPRCARRRSGTVRVPTKPAMHSNLKPAGYSDRKPATLGVNRMGRFDDVVEG